MIFISVLVILLSLSAVSASDDLSNSTVDNFTQFTQDLSSNDYSVNITKDYAQQADEDCINLSKSVSIEGNGHNISSNDTIDFRIKDNADVLFKNLTFRCSKIVFSFDNQTGNESVNITFIDCIFDYNLTSIYESNKYGYEWGYGYSCKVTSEIKELAYKIIGKSKDFEAAKKLTLWVSKNIGYEKRAGFYQSPSETLHRRIGNCCCMSDLLIQMMDAVGLTKNHKIGYVHVGTNKFGKRHYFVVFDDLCIDPTLKSPWGHGIFKDRPAEITLYPLMPLPYGDYA